MKRLILIYGALFLFFPVLERTVLIFVFTGLSALPIILMRGRVFIFKIYTKVLFPHLRQMFLVIILICLSITFTGFLPNIASSSLMSQLDPSIYEGGHLVAYRDLYSNPLGLNYTEIKQAGEYDFNTDVLFSNLTYRRITRYLLDFETLFYYNVTGEGSKEVNGHVFVIPPVGWDGYASSAFVLPIYDDGFQINNFLTNAEEHKLTIKSNINGSHDLVVDYEVAKNATILKLIPDQINPNVVLFLSYSVFYSLIKAGYYFSKTINLLGTS